MTTPMKISPPTENALQKAVEILQQGGLVAFPTETVYGLGADASNPEAVKKIFAAKGRPANHPLIVHIGDLQQLSQWAIEIPEIALRLAAAIWPGPLAMILKKQAHVSEVVTGGQDTIGIRMPDNPVAIALLQQFKGGLAAPSANRFNCISPTRAEHVLSELGASVDMILDGGACKVGLESTIIDLSSEQPTLLRPGHITPQQIEAIIEQPVLLKQQNEIRAPGMLELHYAPTTPAALCANEHLPQQLQKFSAEGKQTALICRRSSAIKDSHMTTKALPDDPEGFGQALYAALRDIDLLKLDFIIIEQLPQHPEWMAVNDRLLKSTAGRILS